MPGRPPSTTRRTALGGLVAVAVLGACDADDLRPPEDDDAAPSSTEDAEVDPDTALVANVAAQVTRAWTVVAAARTIKPLRSRLAPLQRMHEAHLGVLSTTPPPTSVDDVRPPAADPYRRVLDREARLQRTLAAAAVDARSGALARLLASMSASVAQHLAVLPDGGEGQ